MNAHFCMGEFAGISIGEKEHQACGYCGMEDAGCCHDLLQVVKIDDSQLQKTATISLDHNFFIAETAPVFVFNNNSLYFNEAQLIVLPLYLGDPPVYLRNCVFRI